MQHLGNKTSIEDQLKTHLILCCIAAHNTSTIDFPNSFKVEIYHYTYNFSFQGNMLRGGTA